MSSPAWSSRSPAAVGVGDFWRIILSKPATGRILVNIVNQSSMIYLSAVAAAIGFRMGLFNIGVEGQYTIASYAAASRSPGRRSCLGS